MAANNEDMLIQVGMDLSIIKRELRELGQSVTQATTSYVKSFESAGSMIDRSMTSMQDTINRVTGVMKSSGKEWAGALAAPSTQLDALRKKFDPLYAAASKYESAVEELNRAEKIGAISAEMAIQNRLRLTNAYNAQVTAIERVAAAQKTSAQTMVAKVTITPNRGADIAAYGQQLDALRAKYSPLFAAQQTYLANLKDIRTAQSVGAISAAEASAAIATEKTAFAKSVVSIRGTKNAVDDTTKSFKLNRIGLLELQASGINAFQALASGMSAVRVAEMEGAQVIGAIVQGTEGGFRGLISTVGSLIARFPLLTAGVVAAGAAFTVYELIGEKAAKSVSDAVNENATAVSALQKAYGLASQSAEDYARRSNIALESAVRRSAAALKDSIAAEEKNVVSSVSDQGGFSGFGLLQRFGLLGSSDLQGVKLKFAAFAEPIETLRQQIRAGKPDYDEFEASLQRIADTDPKNLGPIADQIRGIVDSAEGGRAHLAGMNEALQQISQNQFDVGKIIAGFGNIEQAAKNANGEIGVALSMLQHMDQLVSGISPKGDAIGGKGAMDRAQQQYNADLNLYRRFGYAQGTGLEIDKAPKATKTSRPKAIPHTANDTITQSIADLQGRTQELAVQRGLLGATYEEQTRVNTAYSLTSKALKDVREEARKKGVQDWQDVQLSDEQKAKIDAASEAYAQQAAAIKQAREAMQEASQAARDFASTFIDDMISGKSATEALGDALKQLGKRFEDLALNSLFGGGSGGGTGLFGQIFGGLFGGGAFPGGGSGPLASFAQVIGLRANGGPVTAGMPYIVGEKRPELFVPSTSGTIIPQIPTIQAGTGSVSTTTMHVTVAVTGVGDKDLLAKTTQGATMAVNQALSNYDKGLPKKVAHLTKNPRMR